MNSFREVISPLLTISCFLGLIDILPNEQRPCLNFVYSFIAWIASVCIFYYLEVVTVLQVIYSSASFRAALYYDLFAIILSTLTNLYYKEKFYNCLKRIDAVDDTLQVLGVAKELSKEYNLSVKIIWAWIFMVATLISVDGVANRKDRSLVTGLCMTFAGDYFVHVNTITDIKFLILLRCIGIRFERVNERIRKLMNDEMSVTRKPRNPVEDEKNNRIIWTAMHLHSELCRISREINSIFELRMTIQMGGYYTILATTIVYISQIDYTRQTTYIFYKDIKTGVIYGWILIFLLRLCFMNYICESVSAKANATNEIINKLINTLHHTEIRKDATQLILQTIQKPLRFPGLGLFYFGYEFIQRFIASISTFAIIFIQMNPLPSFTLRIERNGNVRNY